MAHAPRLARQKYNIKTAYHGRSSLSSVIEQIEHQIIKPVRSIGVSCLRFSGGASRRGDNTKEALTVRPEANRAAIREAANEQRRELQQQIDALREQHERIVGYKRRRQQERAYPHEPEQNQGIAPRAGSPPAAAGTDLTPEDDEDPPPPVRKDLVHALATAIEKTSS